MCNIAICFILKRNMQQF